MIAKFVEIEEDKTSEVVAKFKAAPRFKEASRPLSSTAKVRVIFLSRE